MAGFEFGAISHLDPTKTFVCFVLVIAFVIVFDVVIGVLEYHLEGSSIYNRMVQMIYKELMLMGVVSFIVIMVQAARKADDYVTADEGQAWIKGIDYSHISLFFLTFFFVIHALFFMRQSILSSSRYRSLYAWKVPDLIMELDMVETNPQSSFLYYLQYLPLSHLRDKVEFYLTVSLFRDTYWLPLEFNFADYLSGCYSRYALKTIDRSFFTWGIILVLVALNYLREVLGFRFEGCGVIVTEDDHHTEEEPDDGHRRLAGSSKPAETSKECVYGLMQLFLLGAALLCLYTLLMMYWSRVYKIRMMCRIGFNNPSEYNEFLKFSEKQAEKDKIAQLISKNAPGMPERDRMTMDELKRDIERVLDEDEHEEEAEFKAVAEFLSASLQAVKELLNHIKLQFKIAMKFLRSGCQRTENLDNAPMLTAMIKQSGRFPSEDPEHEAARAGDGLHPESVRAESSRVPTGKLGHMSSSVHSMHSVQDHEGDDAHGHSESSHGGHGGGGGKAAMKQRLTMRASFNAGSMQNSPRGVTRASAGSPRVPAEVLALGNINENSDSIASHDDDHSSLKKEKAAPHTPATVAPTPATTRGAAPSLALTPQTPAPTHQATPSSTPTVSAPSQAAHPMLGALAAPGAPPAAPGGPASKHRNSAGGVMQLLNTINFQEADGPSYLQTPSGKHTLGSSLTNVTGSKGNRRSSIAVHAPENNYSTIEKFRKFKFTERRKALGENFQPNRQGTPRSEPTGVCGWLRSLFFPNKVDIEKQDVEANGDEEFRLSSDFSDIFMWNNPELFYGAVEVCIMFNCLYMSFWVTDFIYLSGKLDQPLLWHILYQLAIAIPAVVVLPCIGYIVETCSLLKAISDLNLDVVHEVLEETEDTKILLQDLRNKMIRRIKVFETMNQDKVQIIQALFNEIDRDGSGNIDKLEFRFLLRTLKLTFSNDRFNRLFRAVDTSGDGNLGWDELYMLLFPQQEEQRIGQHVIPSEEQPVEYIDESQLTAEALLNLGRERLRSLSKISDYSATDSEDEKDKEKGRGGKKSKGSSPSQGLRNRKGAEKMLSNEEDGKDSDDSSEGSDRRGKPSRASGQKSVTHKPGGRNSAMQLLIAREYGQHEREEDLESVPSDS